jgi:hypothetical protein
VKVNTTSQDFVFILQGMQAHVTKSFLLPSSKNYLYIMELFSATKKNEILSFASKQMELENIILSKVSQV